MRLLHTSDWHLGMLFRGKNIKEDQRYFIDQICGIILREKVEGVLLAGDIYDRSIASGDAIELYDEAVTRICGELKVPMMVVAGNHDSAKRLASCRKLLERTGLHIAGVLTADLEPVKFDDVDIYMLPWFTTERVKAVFPEDTEEMQTMEEAYAYVCERMRETFSPDKKHVLVSHAYIINAETSVSDRAAEVGHAAAINASVFDGFDYVALGHIHGPQDIGKCIRYSGTPMPYAFGREEKQVKSVTIIDTDTMERTIIPLEPLYGRMTLRGTFEELKKASDLSERQRNSYLRVEVEDIYVGTEAMARLREIYPNLLEVSGKSYDTGDSGITMTIEELESQSRNPEEVFGRFCMDTMGEKPDEHMLDLFRLALADYEKGGIG